jgi:hypothetical protein
LRGEQNTVFLFAIQNFPLRGRPKYSKFELRLLANSKIFVGGKTNTVRLFAICVALVGKFQIFRCATEQMQGRAI